MFAQRTNSQLFDMFIRSAKAYMRIISNGKIFFQRQTNQRNIRIFRILFDILLHIHFDDMDFHSSPVDDQTSESSFQCK